MGKPSTSCVVLPAGECIACVGVTRGSETSQYPLEEKTIVIPCVVASDSGSRLNHVCVITWQGLRMWGCGTQCLHRLPSVCVHVAC